MADDTPSPGRPRRPTEIDRALYADTLRRLMQEQGLSIRQLKLASRIHDRTIAAILHKQRKYVHPATTRALARHFKVSPIVFTGNGPLPPRPSRPKAPPTPARATFTEFWERLKPFAEFVWREQERGR